MTRRAAPPARLIVVDDDARYGEWLRHHLDVYCPQASVSMLTLREFERWCKRGSGSDCDVLMLGASFGSSPEDPNSQGLALLRQLRAQPATPAVIVLAEDGNELTAVRALQLGAVDYLPKRLLTPERLSTAVQVALHRVERRVARRLASLANLARDGAVAPPREAAKEDTNPAPAPAKAKSKSKPDAVPQDTADEAQPLSSPGVAALLAAPREDLIPNYTLRLKIGESEKATVYLARSARLGHDVALKVSKSVRDEASPRQFLEREYDASLAIRSPLVVEIYDYGVHAGIEFLAMEYLPRGDLKARIQRGVSEQEAMRYVEQIATALKVVHEAGMVHRDLKPPNVLLRESDTVALIDFGLARALDGATTTTQSGVLLGSPYYMSPEQALGEQLDARSDFYSLGIMCYEMLAGHKPYTGSSAMEVLQQHVSAPLPTLPPQLQRYQALLSRLLAKSREERFANAAEIALAAAALRAGASGEAQPSAA